MGITISLAVINVIVFLGLSFGGRTEDAMYMLEHGAMYVPYIMEQQEYYRFFSSMFLHFDFAHLMNNLVTLVVIGRNVEPVVGKIRFLLIYFISGLGGNLVSFVLEVFSVDYVVSAGASGAIFGLTGSLLALTMIYRGHVGNVTRQGMFIMIGVSLYLGFTSQGVDNAAHVGGLICGFLCTLLLVGIPKMWSRGRRWNLQ